MGLNQPAFLAELLLAKRAKQSTKGKKNVVNYPSEKIW